MPVDIDFLSGFYNRHSCYADRLTSDELELIHVPTSVEPALRKWMKSKTDLVLTGNPGDGKTFLLRRLAAEIAKVNGVQILDATAEKDYASIVSRWRKAWKQIVLASLLSGSPARLRSSPSISPMERWEDAMLKL